MFVFPTPHSGPRRLDVDSAGTVWIPEYANNRLAKFDPATSTFSEYELPMADALPYVVRVDADRNRVWIGTGAADAILAFDPVSERFTVYPLESPGAIVRHLAIDPATGDVWAPYGASPGVPSRIVRLSLSESPQEPG
jgi:virginiamycin B lyase